MSKLEELVQGLSSRTNKTENSFATFQDTLTTRMNNSREQLESLSSINSTIHQQNVNLNSTIAGLAAKFDLLLNSQPTVNPSRLPSVKQSLSPSIHTNDSSLDSAASNDNISISDGPRPSHISSAFNPTPLLPRRTVQSEGQKYITKLIPWKSGQDAYYKINSVLSYDFAMAPIQIISVIPEDPPRYEVNEEPYNDTDAWELDHADVFEIHNNDGPRVIEVDKSFSMKPSLWKSDRFTRNCDNIYLEGDSITQVRTFYEDLARLAQSAHSSGAQVLPTFDELLPSTSIATIMQPSPNCYYPKEASAFINLVDITLYHFIRSNKAISPTKCPMTAMHRSSCLDRSGLAILNHIMKKTIPRLGALYVDVDGMIDSLHVKYGETISAFLLRAVGIERTILDSGVQVGPNRLTNKIVLLLRQHDNIVPFIADFIKAYSKFHSKHPLKEYNTTSATAIMESLTENGLTLTERLMRPSQGARGFDTKQRSFDSRPRSFENKSSNQGTRPRPFSKPFVANIDSTASSLHHDNYDDSDNYDDQDSGNHDDQSLPAGIDPDEIEAIQNSIFDMAFENPAMVNALFTSKQQCGICDKPHSTIRCHYLRKENIPPVILRRVEQYRVRLSDEIARLTAQEKAGSTRPSAVRPPSPRQAKIAIETPKLNNLSTMQLTAHRQQVNSPASFESNQASTYPGLSAQEKSNISTLTDLIQEKYGEGSELATPLVASMADERGKSMIVDFGENSNLVPIHAEFEEPLDSTHYDAYGGGSVNW
jgi:hypothetical protein